MRTIVVIVKPRSRQNQVIGNPDGTYTASLTALPHQGQANKALIKVLSRHFHIPPNRFSLVKGHAAKVKRIRIDD